MAQHVIISNKRMSVKTAMIDLVIAATLMAGIAGCSLAQKQATYKVGACGTGVFVTVGLTLLSEYITDVPAQIVGGVTTGECTGAVDDVLALLSNDSQGVPQQQITLHTGVTVDAFLPNTPLLFPVSNCQASTALVNDEVTVQEGAMLFPRVGGRAFESRPSNASIGDDPIAAAAQALIDTHHLAVGTFIYRLFTTRVSIPAHAQVFITPPSISANLALGSADLNQSGNTLSWFNWSYPVNLTLIGGAKVSQPSTC